MKLNISVAFLVCLTGISCEKSDQDLNGNKLITKNLTDGFCMVFADSTVINHEQIEYYDLSSHIVYLKEPHSFFQGEEVFERAISSFSVYAFKQVVYNGTLFPAWYSSMPDGAYVDWPSFYPPYLIRINFRKPFSIDDPETVQDPRLNEKVLKALQEYDQLHHGLSCNFSQISLPQEGKVSFKITVENKDNFNYYHAHLPAR